MLKFYLNRELSERLGIPLNRWKRWSREFLPPDPLGGLQSGYARQYSIRDAFHVYLAGYLVSATGFSIPEARLVLNDLKTWLKKNIIDNHEAGDERFSDRVKNPFNVELQIIPTRCNAPPSFSYRIRSLIECRSFARDDQTFYQETFMEEVIKPGESVNNGCYPTCPQKVDLSTLVSCFFKQLENNKG